jgi:hypothetical protein
MVVGTVIHQVLSIAYKYMMSGEMMPLERVMETFDRFWTAEAGRNVIWDTDPDSLKQDAKTLVEIYHHDIMPRYVPVASEQKYEARIGDVIYRGIIDLEIKPILFEDAPRIVDFKIRKRRISQPESDKDIQISSYGLLKGMQPLVAEFHVGLMQKKPTWEIVRTQRDEKDYAFLSNMVKQTYELVTKSGEYIPNISFWGCAPFDEERGVGCEYYDLCHLV